MATNKHNLFGDSSTVLEEQIKVQSVEDYAIFDLGEGDKWLSSRIYLFTKILQRMRGIKYIVFVDSYQGTAKHFVGIVESSKVEYTFAMRYQWFEPAFSNAFCQAYSPNQYPPSNKLIKSTYGLLDQSFVIQVIKGFIQNIQKPPNEKPPNKEWIKIDKTKAWEHAEFLDSVKVQEILYEVIYTAFVDVLNIKDRSKTDQIKLILRFKEPIVALVDQKQRFQKLIDRQLIEDQVINNVIDT